MTDLRAAAETLVELLSIPTVIANRRSKISLAVEALRTALAQGEQEPVAWRWENNGSDNWIRKYTYLDNGAPDEPELCEALYTAQPSKPCAITDLLQQKFQSGNNVPVERVTITRSEYEAALRSKNT